MSTKKIIRRIAFTTIWVAIGSGLLVLLVAAIGKKNKEQCRDYVITIKGAQDNFFIDKNDVSKLLMAGVNGKIKGQPIAAFNLRELEQLLKDNTWISNADLYFDNQDVLHVTVQEREPVARIFTTGTNSFYIDSSGKKMPLSDKLSARVPVFTNFPDKAVLNAKDSMLLSDIKKTSLFILNDAFWMSQVEQIDITPQREFEMVPTVGNQIIKLGDGTDIEKKFKRLYVFYQQVLSKTGFNKYDVVDVQYAGQIVAAKGKVSKVDSVQLKQNIEKLLQQARQERQDTTMLR